ncbi:MAG: DUF4291 domain-containing protein [Chloroflexi bacterium]|nr:DUF4291 domain-containing protein [Chloroflexota bacterium]
MQRQIYADYDDSSIYVYQAFKPSIVAAALGKGTFGKGFGLDRMTWIKPSFGWMLHRSGYARKHRQEAILKIKLSHEAFLKILNQSIETSYNPDLFADEAAWQNALTNADVIHQWDPDRELSGKKLDRRAIQIGLRGQAVYDYVNEWIIGLEEVTALAHEIEAAGKSNEPLPDIPVERVYPVENQLVRSLNITTT